MHPRGDNPGPADPAGGGLAAGSGASAGLGSGLPSQGQSGLGGGLGDTSGISGSTGAAYAHLPTPTFHDEPGEGPAVLGSAVPGTGAGRHRHRAKFSAGELA